MKRLHAVGVRTAWFTVLLVVVLSTVGVFAGTEKLHPALRAAVEALDAAETAVAAASAFPFEDEARMRFEFSVSPVTGVERMGVLVKTETRVMGTRFGGLPLRASSGTVQGLWVTVGELLTLASRDDVIYVEPSWRVELKLDESVPAIGADAVHLLDPAITGAGVIIGSVDTGIDYEHLDFRYDADGNGSEESTRILAIWDQTYGLLGGAEYTQDDIEADLAAGYGPMQGVVRQSDTNGHGTHVMGIAAGDGSSSEYGFVGVAPGAWIVAVKTTFYTSDILAGVEYVFDLADDLDVPAVVNLSLGGHDGPHDGTSLFEQGLEELADGPGRIVVVSAGNEGDQLIHTGGSIYGGSSTFTVEVGTSATEIALWYPGTSSFTIAVKTPGGSSVVVPVGTASGYQVTAYGLVYIDNAASGKNTSNGDREVYIRLSGTTSGDEWKITVTDDNNGGRYDAWITSDAGTILDGDSLRTIDEPGNAYNVITVGAFNTKNSWPSLSGTQNYPAYTIGAISSFSSIGPTRDGRQKPDISAPGAWIVSALSASATSLYAYTHADGVHVAEIGTSMAAPHVSGAVALLLSIDETLDTDDILDLLTGAAVTDTATGSVPNPAWGWGKLDALSAVEELQSTEEPEEPPVEVTQPTVGLQENPVSSRAVFEVAFPDSVDQVTLRIYSISGRLVFEVSVDPDDDTVTWNLQSMSGNALASGIYLYLVVTDEGPSEIGKLVILR